MEQNTNVANQQVTPVQTNIQGLDDYDIGTPTRVIKQQAFDNAGSKPMNLQEEINGKPLEEQIDIINKYNEAEEIKPASEAPEVAEDMDPVQPKQEEEQENKEDIDKDKNVDKVLEELENEIENRKLKKEEENPDNREELTAEEWEQHRAEFESLENEVKSKEDELVTIKKDLYKEASEKEIWKSTAESLKEKIKDLQSKADYLESSREVIQGPEELQLISLRRSAASDESGESVLSYLYQLAEERTAITGQDLRKNLTELFKDNIKGNSVSASEYQEEVIKKPEPKNDLDHYAL